MYYLDKLHLCPGCNVALARLHSLPVNGGFRARCCTARCDVTADTNFFNCLGKEFLACGTFGALNC